MSRQNGAPDKNRYKTSSRCPRFNEIYCPAFTEITVRYLVKPTIAAFGPDARRDRTLAGRMKVSNRHIKLFGFMPELTVKHERRSSNLSLYDSKRNVVEVGVVRTF